MAPVDTTTSRGKTLAKRLCLAAVSVVIPFLLLAIVEVALRLTGVGYNPHFIVHQRVGEAECWVRNPSFSWRFFPRPMARLSTAMAVPVSKPKDVVRVVVLGSSAALGDPEPSFGFSRMLEVMLQARFPGKQIEVINTAATAINSNVILPIAEDCAALEPDVFVVYSGNNEVVGPYGLSAALTPFFSSRAMIRAQIGMGSLRLVQWLKSFSRQKAVVGDEWRGMELFLENKVRLGDPNLEKVYSHFEGNLMGICRVAKRVGARVVLCSVIVNDRDSAPFISLHRNTLDETGLTRWNTLFEQGKSAESSGHWAEAFDVYEKAAAVDSDYAELHFRLAKCLWNEGKKEMAKAEFEKARDLDGLRFRADTRLNAVIRNVAAQAGAVFVDAQDQARKASPGGIPGENLLYEHVHLNFAGNYLLARACLEPCEQALGWKSDLAVPDEAECQKRLAWTVFDEKRIWERLQSRLQNAPFTNQFDHAQVMQRVKDRLASLESASKGMAQAANTVYQNALAARPRDWQLRMNYLQFLYEQAQFGPAHEQAKQVFDMLPMEHFSLMNMGVTLQKLRRFDEAEKYLHRAIAVNPYLTEGYEKLGLLREDQRRFEEAEAFLLKRHSPALMAGFFTRVGLHYARQHSNDVARLYFNKALLVVPGYAEAVANLKRLDQPAPVAIEESESYRQGLQLMKEGQFATAADAWAKLVTASPQSVRARNNYGFCLVKMGRYEEAVQQFSEAARLAPESTEGLQNLASVYGLMDRHTEAITALRQAVALKPSQSLYLFLAEEYGKIGQQDEAERYRVLARTLKP
jgi:tetratricopeptide (TPR) repeat protein